MINCPNCDKQIADDAAHCGYCGHQLEEKSKKKTMFGMAAIGGDELKKAVEDAKKAKDEKGDGEQKKAGGGLKIPKPGQKSAGKSTDAGKSSGGSGFKIPKPGQKANEQPEQDAQADEAAWAKTERIDLSDAEPPSGISEPSEADTQPHDIEERFADQQRLETDEATGDDAGTASTISMSAPSEDDLDSVPPAQTPQSSQPSFGEPAGPGPSQVSQAGEQSGPFGPGAQEAEEAQQPQQPQQAASPATTTPPPGGPSPADQQGDMRVHKVGKGGPPAPEKKSKKGLIIGLVLVAMIFGGACMLGAGYYVYTNFF
jgi:hypothetical protein